MVTNEHVHHLAKLLILHIYAIWDAKKIVCLTVCLLRTVKKCNVNTLTYNQLSLCLY